MKCRIFIWCVLLHFLSENALLSGLPTGPGVFQWETPQGKVSLPVHYFLADKYRPEVPPVLILHGMGRNADEYRDAWVELAKQHHFFVLAPEFSQEAFPGTESYNLGNVFPSEHDLQANSASQWSYTIPTELFLHLRRTGGETQASGYFIFGHSAGSQFLHRSLYFVPDRCRLLAIAANAGWYTLPSFASTWPYGLAGSGLAPSRQVEALSTPMVVLLGLADIDPSHQSLRRSPEAMRQGATRLARGEYFYLAGKRMAAQLEVPFGWQLEYVTGAEHDNKAMAPVAARLMVEWMQQHPSPETVPVLPERLETAQPRNSD